MENKFRIITDPKYGFLRADPIPTQEEVERYYAEEFYSSEYKSFNDSSYEVQLDEKEFFEAHWENHYQKIVKFFRRTKDISLFDMGCGFGLALKYYREKGLKVAGMDPAPEAVTYAKKNNLDVHLAGIEDISFIGSKRFDVVTLFNVLEHLRQPADTLQNIRNKMLNDNGLLVIDVPNDFNDFQDVANSEFNLGQWWFCPPNHINYFSATSLKNLLEDSGYKVYEMESSFPLEIFLLMGDVYIGNESLGKICHNKRVKFEQLMKKHGKGEKLRLLYQSLAQLDLGRQIVAYATPN
jgi:2-polyprenyl-3-methyl-5-hydroxy-6-metoxy-1,4-benzoquinol methylase